MGELLQINIGNVGNDIGFQYLQELVRDHCLLSDDLTMRNQNKKNIKTSFKEEKENQYIFKGIFDYSDQLQAELQNKSDGQFIDTNSILPQTNNSYQGTFNQSKNNFEAFQKDVFIEKVRKNVEESDRLVGFNFAHSAYDNSLGAACLAMTSAKEQYPQLLSTGFVVYPNLQYTNAIDIYNAVFSIHYFVENYDMVMMYDYQALSKIIQNSLNSDTFSNYHNIVSGTMLQLTCSQRFGGHQIGSLRKLATNMIPFPRLHFLTCSLSQLKSQDNLTEQIQILSNPQKSYFTFSKNAENRYFCQTLLTRCFDNNLIFQEATKNFFNKTEWINDAFYQINCSKEHKQLGKTIMHVGNQSHFGDNFKPYAELFLCFYRRKTFIHHYIQEGADEMEFVEAESNLNDLVSEYQGGCCCCGDYDEEEYF